MSLQNGYQIPSQSSMSSRGPQTLQNITHALPNGPPPSSSLASLVSPLTSRHNAVIGSTSTNIHGPGASGAAQATSEAIINGDMPVKRGPGRPKGSTNKNKPPQLNPDGTLIPKRPVGRPRKEVDPNAPVKPKNPVGRPRKHPLPPDSNNLTSNARPTQSSASTSAPTSTQTTTYTAQHQLNPPSGSNGARLASSPTLASSTSVQGHPWSGTNGPNTPSTLESAAGHMNAAYRPMSNGHVTSHGHAHGPQISRTHQTPSTLATSSASSSGQFQSPQISVYESLSSAIDSELLPNGILESPLLHPSQSPAAVSGPSPLGRKPTSPALTPTVSHSQNNRHLTTPAPLPSTSTAQLSPTPLSNQNTPSIPPRHFTATPRKPNTPPNREVTEASIWKEIQALGFVNPRVVVENAKSRSADASALKRIVPPDVFLAYADHLRELRRETPAGCPDAYTILNSFWLPGIASYFQLTTSRSSASTPPSNYRFFYWDPMYLLVGGIPCPHCSSQLVRDGFHGPCPVIDLGDPFYLIGQAYKCATCSRRQEGPAGGVFLSWDEGILKSLPAPLAKEFPAYNTPWGSFSNEIRDLVRAMAKEGMDPKHVAGAIKAVCKPGGSSVPEGSTPRMQGLESPITAPASPELPERQRIYYQAWHRNGRLSQSLGASGGSPVNPGRPGSSDSLFGEEEAREVDEINFDPTIKKTGSNAVVNNSPANPPVSRSPRPSTSSTASKPPSQKGPPKSVVATVSATSGGNVPAHPVGAMPPPTYFVPPAATPGVRYFPTPPMPQPSVTSFYPSAPPPPVSPVPPSSASSSNATGGGDSLRRSNPYSETDTPSPKKRRVRHCAKCGSPACKGRGGGSNCPNACRDCGKVECKGRSSTKPGRVCETAAVTSSVTD